MYSTHGIPEQHMYIHTNENFENWVFSKMKFPNNWVTMTASYIPAMFSKILFSKSLTADVFEKPSIQKLLHLR